MIKNKRIFIGWSGNDNRDIATMLSNKLSEDGYFPIIGGEWRTSFTVSEEIIHQMNGCDFGLFLIEKEIRKNEDKVISIGFNSNVMMELGYMLRKVNDYKRVRRFLINVSPNELPSDLLGTWTDEINKIVYEQGDVEARHIALTNAADEIFEKFVEFLNSYKNSDKLDYFDEWQENKFEIYNFSGDVHIGEMLIYGMQAAIYSGDFDILYQNLLSIKKKLTEEDRFNDYAAVMCAIAIIKVFVDTRRLTIGLTDDAFDELKRKLNTEYEKNIMDNDLKTWCTIFRHDKLDLCYELYAKNLSDIEEKIYYYKKALSECHLVLEMIKSHVKSSPDYSEADEATYKDYNFSLLYTAFATRNISQIHKLLAELEPDKKDYHFEEQKKYCRFTYENRELLYNHCIDGSYDSSFTVDYITQEYFLALVEQYEFEDDIELKRDMKRNAISIYNKLMDKLQVQNMILETVKNYHCNFLGN